MADITNKSTMQDMPLSYELIQTFLDFLLRKGISDTSLSEYSSLLYHFYLFLPSEKRVKLDTLELWKKELVLSGYKADDIVKHLSAVNSLLYFYNRTDLRILL